MTLMTGIEVQRDLLLPLSLSLSLSLSMAADHRRSINGDRRPSYYGKPANLPKQGGRRRRREGGEMEKVMEDISTGSMRLTELRSLVLPLLPAAGGGRDLAADLFDDALRSFSSAMSELGSSSSSQAPAPRIGSPADNHQSRTKRVRSSATAAAAGRRRKQEEKSVTIITTSPYYDGRQWNKYGEKSISTSKFPRCYYRCAYRDDRGCPATKRVEKLDEGFPAKFVVTYGGSQHTCCRGSSGGGSTTPAAAASPASAAESSVLSGGGGGGGVIAPHAAPASSGEAVASTDGFADQMDPSGMEALLSFDEGPWSFMDFFQHNNLPSS